MIQSTPQLDIDVVRVPMPAIDAGNAAEFRALLEEHLEVCQRIVIDFSDVEFIDSAGLAALVWAIRQTSRLGREVRVCGARHSVQALFELVRMNRITSIYADSGDAVASFRV